MAIPTTQKECTTRRIASLIIGLWDKVKNAFLLKTSRGAANGVASLDANGKVPTSQLPAVDTFHGTMTDNFTRDIPDQSENVDWVSTIGLSNNGFWLLSLRAHSQAPYWMIGDYSSGIAFGGQDTKSVLSVSFRNENKAIRIASGNGSAPKWWAGLKFGDSKEYEIGTGKYIPSCPDKGKGNSSTPVYVDSNGIIQSCTNVPVIEHVTTIPVNPTVGTIYAL